jgi:hypothetical protein
VAESDFIGGCVLAILVEGDAGLHEITGLEDHRLVLVSDGRFAHDDEVMWVGHGAGDDGT